jgi:hypothetical protein
MVRRVFGEEQPPQANATVVTVLSLGKSTADAQRMAPIGESEVLLETRLLSELQGSREKHRAMQPSDMSMKTRHRWWRGKSFGERGLSFVVPSIVLGSANDAQNVSMLRGIGVTHILNVARDIPLYHPQEFVCYHMKMDDDVETVLGEDFNQALAFIRRVEAVNGRCLVHCKSGVSRAASVVLAYLMLAHQIPLRVAYEYLRFVRPFVSPNDGFKCNTQYFDFVPFPTHNMLTLSNVRRVSLSTRTVQLANIELQLFGASSMVSHPHFDFFTWNNMKYSVPVFADGDGLCCVVS